MSETKGVTVLDVVIELGVIRMRPTIGSDDGPNHHPRVCLCVDQSSGMILSIDTADHADIPLKLVVDSLLHLIKDLKGLPRQVQLRDPRLAGQLKEVVGRFGLDVVVRESLPKLNEAVDGMANFGKLGGKPKPALLDVPGMTLDHLIAFADAAQAFYLSKPWRHLLDEDLIAIESPAGPSGIKFAQVLGAAGHTFGLSFVDSRKAHENILAGKGLPHGPIWNLLFGDIDRIPFDDGEIWERYNLPIAGPDAYPCFVRHKTVKGFDYPTPDQLIWAEGLLRAIAATTEEELDSGRWEKTVEIVNGATTYKFSMPILLEQMAGTGKTAANRPPQSMAFSLESMQRAMHQQIARHQPKDMDEVNELLKSMRGNPPEFVPTNDVDRAQEICYQAFDARGRRQVQLARQALAIDPDCCDALLLLAERDADPKFSLPLVERAVQAGEKQLGTSRFEKDAGHFWGILETRPYMRARRQLALIHQNLEQFDQAVGHFLDLLRLNPNDNQGNRYDLAQCLLENDQLDDLDELLNRSAYKDDFAAEWMFTKALLDFRRAGDTAEVRKRLQAAQRCNSFVVPLLIGDENTPDELPEMYSPGSEKEAAICVDQIAIGWEDTPGAMEWLEEIVETQKRRRQKERNKRNKLNKRNKRRR